MRHTKSIKKITSIFITAAMMFSLASCANETVTTETGSISGATTEKAPEVNTVGDSTISDADTTEEKTSETKDDGDPSDIYILCTSDVHCGVDKGFGYAGLKAIRDSLEEKGYKTILIDDGDAIQGEPIGTLSKGEAIVELMNDLKYDVAIPGNHEFDYGMENFLTLTKEADYPYISCNFNKDGEFIFEPYVIKEVGDLSIAFVGVTTPWTLVSSTPLYFQNDKGEFVYDFMNDDDGTKLYETVQNAVDDARAEGADLVYVMAHCGNEATYTPWTYADIISHTNGIDVFFDGHSHDTEQVVMKNKDGEEVTRSAVGTKLSCIGYSHISADGEILETGIWSWTNDFDIPEVFKVENDISKKVDAAKKKLNEELGTVVAATDVELAVNDPVAVDSSGYPIRMIRRAETNLGDFCADAFRVLGNADIGICNGGGIRDNIAKGDITYGDLINVFPYGNELCVLEVTGQQVLDALEWGARSVPEECGAFLQVSGLTYEIDVNVDSTCTEDENGMFTGVSGARRVKNVMVGSEPIDPSKTYTLASHNYTLLELGDGCSMFKDCKVLQDRIKLDNQVLIDYITEELGGKVGDEYSDPYGQGRIVIIE